MTAAEERYRKGLKPFVVLRLKYKTKEGDRQTSLTYIVTLFP
jgi:hypothetical protein